MAIPTDLRVPFVYVEFDPSRAFQGPSILRYKVLMVGGRLSGGTKPQLSVDRVFSKAEGQQFYGVGSQLSRMIDKWFEAAPSAELWCCSLDDAGAGVAATGSIVLGGTATSDGTLAVYIGGTRIPVTVLSGDTGSVVGDALVAAMPTDSLLTASNAAGTVTFMARNDGEPGNEVDIRLNYNLREELPAGITATVNGMTGGSNNPSMQDVLDVIGDEWYNLIVAPYWDDTNLATMETELASRFGPTRMIDGVYLSSRRGTAATLSSWGSGKNSPHVSIIHSEKIPTSSLEVASAYAAQLAKEGQADPARPFQTLEMVGVLPPAVEEVFILEENNSLLWDGVSTFSVDSGGKVRIQRAITMYQVNDAGAPDIAYLDVNTMLTLMYLRWDFRTQILTRYPRAKLSDDGVQVGPGQVVITPKLGKSESVNIFTGWEKLGLVEGKEQFKRDVVCVRSTVDPNRLEWSLPPDLMNQFRVGAATMQFLLQAPAV